MNPRPAFAAVAFDLDDTLLRNTASVRLLCELNGRTEDLDALKSQELLGA